MKRVLAVTSIAAAIVLVAPGAAFAGLESVVYDGPRTPGGTITLSALCWSDDVDGNISPGSLSGAWGLARETAPGSGTFENYVVASDFTISTDPIPDPFGSFRNVSGSIVIPADAPLDREYRLGGGACIFQTAGDGGSTSFPTETFSLGTAPTTVAPTTVAPTTAAPTTVAPTTVAPTTAAPIGPGTALPATGPVTPGLPFAAAAVLGVGLVASVVARRIRPLGRPDGD